MIVSVTSLGMLQVNIQIYITIISSILKILLHNIGKGTEMSLIDRFFSSFVDFCVVILLIHLYKVLIWATVSFRRWYLSSLWFLFSSLIPSPYTYSSDQISSCFFKLKFHQGSSAPMLSTVHCEHFRLNNVHTRTLT